MSDLVVQSGLLTAIGILIIAFVLGVLVASATYIIMFRKRSRENDIDADIGDVALYMIFSRLSHHLKTAGEIIRGHMRGFTEDLPSDDERWRVARRAIFDEANEITGTVERLDLVVRLGMTDQPMVMEPVNVAAAIEDLMVGLGPSADDRGVQLGGVAGNTSNYISGDGGALREAFSNILENAVTHGNQGTEVTAEIASRNGAVHIQFSDTGPGMDEEQLGTLFTPGARAYRPGASRGTGMGLALSKRLIEMHGGTIAAASTPGEGTSFQIVLPARRTES